ncbi:MAG: thioredoxin family protein [Lentisphaeria bacterium]|nr:thioredoxin family protein [Lentisphaeria bacterium]
MKKFLIACAAVCCAALMAAPAPKGWTTDYDGALKQAAREKKCVLVLFTGSEWCGWCKKLRKETLDQAAFRKFAAQNLVLVYMDIPRGPEPAGPTRLKEVSAKLRPGGGVPCTVIVGADGTVKGKISGHRPLKRYIAEIKELTK